MLILTAAWCSPVERRRTQNIDLGRPVVRGARKRVACRSIAFWPKESGG